MARKTGQIIGRAPRTWVVRVYVGRDAETKKRIERIGYQVKA